MFALVGAPELAQREITAAADTGLIDVVWMEHCPQLQPLRGQPAFARAQSTVEQRVVRRPRKKPTSRAVVGEFLPKVKAGGPVGVRTTAGTDKAPMSTPIERLLRTLVLNLVRDHQIPNAPVRTTLRVDANAAAIPITVSQLGSGTIVFATTPGCVPGQQCVLSIAIGQSARVDFPVRVAAEGPLFRASMVGAALVLRRRTSRNVRLEEALGVAA